ncbi:hypothetical protein ADH76_27760 [Enterocloster clostridioformis]|jgi:hypothetical protein|uniref:hypothetical protein n=1 Tax=Enterocloster clostridioformis TaxID=1531 RepID=UPI0005707A88|nr:hypothetical protein [Enterocloster clostridioformis]ANU48848.1 hypothetical protein A4V08_26630 [Lachnoclostridium sp. YL32]NDO27097.1 hypothetical protein [Enterocloster clostridioformis]OXE63991.1 hypothetical protein ADH76_27760 [Enterocloster clostridioformis]
MSIPSWCRECPFYYPGMTVEDYLYLQYCMRINGTSDAAIQIQRGEIRLPRIEQRTKEDVFAVFHGDVGYVFNKNTMI